MVKKLLITLILGFSVCTNVFAQSYEVDYFNVNVNGFIDTDSTSTVDVNPQLAEVGIYVDVIVRVLDRNNTPLSGRQISLYAQGNPSSVTFIQPDAVTDSDGYAFGKVRSSSQGTYTIKALDTTFSNDIDIVDSANLSVFPIPSPNMLAEPYYTKGNTNRVFWDLTSGMSTYTYYVEVSSHSDFSTIDSSSGWISSKSYEFTNLNLGKLYYYRVKAKNIGGAESDWSNTVFSIQDGVPPVIKYVDISRVYTKGIFSGISVKFDVTDDFEVDYVDFFCVLQDGSKKICGDIEKSGVRYYVNIPSSEMEKGSFGTYYDNYKYCVTAYDKAGNSSSNCDFNIDVKEYVKTDLPLFTALINSIYKLVNDSFKDIAKFIDYIDINFQEVGLQLLSILLFIFVVLTSLSLLAQGIFVIPNYILYLFFKSFIYLGHRKNGEVIGMVYDSVTGKAIKYARADVYDRKNSKLFTSISDRNGFIYGTLDTGKYRVMVRRSNYLFPSQMYKEYEIPKSGKLYLGEYIIVSKRNPMNLLIPLDPLNVYTSFEKNYNLEARFISMLKAITFLGLTVGLLVSVITFEKYANILNLIFLLMYIPVFGLYLKSVIHIKVK